MPSKPLLLKKEEEKCGEYQALKDFAITQWLSWNTSVAPLLYIGDLRYSLALERNQLTQHKGHLHFAPQ